MIAAQARMNALAAAREFPGLYRAVVSVPDALSTRERPLEDRFVFFEGDPPRRPVEALTDVLRSVWRVDTTDWSHNGAIYNVYSAIELIRDRVEDGIPPAHALFDIGGGGDGFDPRLVDGVRYARMNEVDLFVRPQARHALLRVICEIDARFDAAAAARAGGR
jgi:hypothetical protein